MITEMENELESIDIAIAELKERKKTVLGKITEISFKDHEEWLAIRCKYIGGSDAGAVIGLNPYKSAYALWAEKTNKISGFVGNITTQVGAYLEEFVAKLFEEETGKKVRKKNRTMVNDLYPFACANVDRLVVGEKAFLEIKTTTSIPIMKQLRETEFPEHYYAQCVHYLAVTGLEKCYLAVLVNCREFKVFELERDQNEIDALMKAEKEFWECVKNDVPPVVDGSDSTSDTISELYPSDNGFTIALHHDDEIREYLAISEQIKALTKLKDEKANIVKAYMEEASAGESDSYKVTYKVQGRRTFDAKAFAGDHPELDLTDYYKVTTSRVFKVKEI